MKYIRYITRLSELKLNDIDFDDLEEFDGYDLIDIEIALLNRDKLKFSYNGSNRNLSDSDIEKLSPAFLKTKKAKILYLANNSFSTRGAVALSKVISMNEFIDIIEFKGNTISKDGLLALTRALITNPLISLYGFQKGNWRKDGCIECSEITDLNVRNLELSNLKTHNYAEYSKRILELYQEIKFNMPAIALEGTVLDKEVKTILKQKSLGSLQEYLGAIIALNYELAPISSALKAAPAHLTVFSLIQPRTEEIQKLINHCEPEKGNRKRNISETEEMHNPNNPEYMELRSRKVARQ